MYKRQIFDRGPRPDIILDELMRHHSVDVQWGNHDVQWMGAAAGSTVCAVSYTHLYVFVRPAPGTGPSAGDV